MEILTIILIISGIFFFVVGTIGIIRLPDFFTRMHAAGNYDTLGIFLVLLGLVIHLGLTITSLKILLIALFIYITSPIATHSIARAALKNNIPFWQIEEKK